MTKSIRQTKTDRNRHAKNWPLCAGSCKVHIIGEKELEIERERETESKTERHTCGERSREKGEEREGETQRGKDREVSITPGRSSNTEVSLKQ